MIKLQLADILTAPVTTVPANCSVENALAIMREQRISSIVVTEGKKPVGIFTERDAVTLTYRHQDAEHLPVQDVMGTPPLTAPLEMDYREAYRLIADNRVRHLIVIDEQGETAGIVSESSFMQHLGSEFLVQLKEVGSLMTHNVITLPLDASVEDAVRLMARDQISCVVVEDAGAPAGIFTERDLVRLSPTLKKETTLCLDRIMAHPVRSVRVDTPVQDAIKIMDQAKIRRLVVIRENGSIAGLVTRNNIVRQLYDTHIEHLRQTLDDRERELEILKHQLQLEKKLRNTEEALKESERRLKLALSAGGIGTWSWDISTDIVFADKHFAELTGMPEALTLEGFSFGRMMQTIHQDDRDECHEVIGECLSVQGTDRYSLDFRVIWNDGSVHWLSALGEVSERETSGNATSLHGCLIDITDRKEAEIALRKSQNKYKNIIENSPDIMYQAGLDGRVIFVSSSIERVSGFSTDEVIGQSIAESFYVRPEERKLLLEQLEKHGFIEGFEAELKNKNGSTWWASANVHYLTDELGNVQGVEGIVRDITAQKKSEQQLRESEELFRALFEQSGGYTLILDPSPSDSIPIIIDANEAACIAHGYSRDEFIGRSVADIDEEAGETLIRERTEEIMSGKPFYVENTHVRKDGSTFQVAVNARRIDIGDGPPLILSREYDITQQKEAERDLSESERRFRATFDQAAVGIGRAAPNGRWLEVNDKLCEIVGYSREELLDKTFQEITYPDDLDRDLALVDEVLSGKRESFSMDKRYIKGSGALVWIRLTVSLVRDDNGEPLYFVGVIEDIDKRKKNAEKLMEAAAVFRSTGEGVTITDHEGTILDVNDAFTRITGYSREEVIGHNPRILQSGRHDNNFYSDMWNQLREKGQWHGEIWNRAKNGTVYPEILTISSVEPEEGGPRKYVGVFADISSLKATEARLDHLAHHDSLTGLPNRLLFRDRLIHSLASSDRKRTKVAVVFLDLDRFKNINDTLGHGVGDQLLIEVSERITRITRASDTVGRISGDEFCLVLEDLHFSIEVVPVVEKIVQIFADPFEVDGHILRVSSSIGIALYPDNSKDADALLSFADAAMYEAKEAGRNTYRFYTREMTEQAQEHSFVQSALRDAMDHSQFYLVYQPQIDLNTHNLVGLEVLSRWQHPSRGLIPPNMFIPVAEQSGLIRELGAWILRTATAQARAWLDEGHEFGRIYVNVAGPQLHDAGFPELVKICLTDSGLPPERLGLEVTESFAMRASEHAFEVLSSLRDLGIELAIDDFGTGYSSLSYLKQLPVHKLKIDQSFVRDIPADPNDMAIAEAVISMGRALNLKVIAEGVEKQEQAAFVYGKGCQEAQGYLYSRPLTPDQFKEWMAQTIE